MSTTVLQDADIDRALTRISYEIIEANEGVEDLVILGIPSRGVPLASQIAQRIEAASNGDFKANDSFGILDITMYRDDLARQPLRTAQPTVEPRVGIDGKHIVLVDDVLYSGRTVRAALDALADLGRPDVVKLAVLVDRGHRRFPIRADFVGKNIPTSLREKVNVHIQPIDAENAVVID